MKPYRTTIDKLMTENDLYVAKVQNKFKKL
jgi:hypothetical protein